MHLKLQKTREKSQAAEPKQAGCRARRSVQKLPPQPLEQQTLPMLPQMMTRHEMNRYLGG
jgi:hypothetical protein